MSSPSLPTPPSPDATLMVLQRTTRRFAVYQEHVEKLEDQQFAAIHYHPRKLFDAQGKPGILYITVSKTDN